VDLRASPFLSAFPDLEHLLSVCFLRELSFEARPPALLCTALLELRGKPHHHRRLWALAGGFKISAKVSKGQ